MSRQVSRMDDVMECLKLGLIDPEAARNLLEDTAACTTGLAAVEPGSKGFFGDDTNRAQERQLAAWWPELSRKVIDDFVLHHRSIVTVSNGGGYDPTNPYSMPGYMPYPSGPVGSATNPSKPAGPKYGDPRPNMGCKFCKVKGHIRVTKVDSDGTHLLCKLCGKTLLEVPK